MSTNLKIKFEEWMLFVVLADSGSISGASKVLEADASSLKRRLDAFEAKLSLQLFVRSRNGLTLTVSGRSLYFKAKPLVEAALSAVKSVSDEAPSRSKLLAAMPKYIYESIGFYALKKFELERPGAAVDLALYESEAPEWAKNADVFITSSIFAASGMTRIGAHRRIICAATSYCMREGAPIIPEDLRHHKVFGVGIRGRSRGFLVSGDVHHPISLSSIIECSGYSELEARIAAGEGIAIAMPVKSFERLSRSVEMTRIMPDHRARNEALWARISPELEADSNASRFIEILQIESSLEAERESKFF